MPGEFRRSQNWIGPAGSTLSNATYVPPPPEEMKACLSNWENYLQNRNQFPELIQCALLHEQFEAIHPFLDGNGRVGRLLITLFLIERGRLTQPLLYLSAYFESHRQEYYAYLQKVKTDGDWNNWILFQWRYRNRSTSSSAGKPDYRFARKILERAPGNTQSGCLDRSPIPKSLYDYRQSHAATKHHPPHSTASD